MQFFILKTCMRRDGFYATSHWWWLFLCLTAIISRSILNRAILSLVVPKMKWKAKTNEDKKKRQDEITKTFLASTWAMLVRVFLCCIWDCCENSKVLCFDESKMFTLVFYVIFFLRVIAIFFSLPFFLIPFCYLIKFPEQYKHPNHAARWCKPFFFVSLFFSRAHPFSPTLPITRHTEHWEMRCTMNFRHVSIE